MGEESLSKLSDTVKERISERRRVEEKMKRDALVKK